MPAEARRAGVVLADEDRLCFVDASVAERVLPSPAVARVPGAHAELVGVALVEGAIVPVVSIGHSRGEMLLVRHAGEPLGLVGAHVRATGLFPEGVTAGSVEWRGRVAEALDLDALYRRLRAGSWAGRSGG